MTEEQFEKMMSKLEEINQSVLIITAKDAGENRWNLSDVCSELSTVASEVGSVESAIGNLKS